MKTMLSGVVFVATLGTLLGTLIKEVFRHGTDT